MAVLIGRSTAARQSIIDVLLQKAELLTRLLRDALADGLRQAEAPPPQSTLQLSLDSCLT